MGWNSAGLKQVLRVLSDPKDEATPVTTMGQNGWPHSLTKKLSKSSHPNYSGNFHHVLAMDDICNLPYFLWLPWSNSKSCWRKHNVWQNPHIPFRYNWYVIGNIHHTPWIMVLLMIFHNISYALKKMLRPHFIYPLVMTNTSPWFFDGPNRNRWSSQRSKPPLIFGIVHGYIKYPLVIQHSYWSWPSRNSGISHS